MSKKLPINIINAPAFFINALILALLIILSIYPTTINLLLPPVKRLLVIFLYSTMALPLPPVVTLCSLRFPPAILFSAKSAVLTLKVFT